MSGEDEDDWFERALRKSEAEEGNTLESEGGEGDSAEEPDFGGESDFGDAFDASGDLDDDDDDDPFGENFATAFQNAPSPGGEDAGGFSGAAQGESGGFEEKSFETDLPRVDIGIGGLDDMIQEGVPRRTLMVAIGSAGTGKTTFGLQFIHHGLQQGESAVFITLEENHDRIINSADDKGWNFSEYEEEGKLAVVDLDPIEMANSLTSIRSELPNLVQEFNASRLVLDSVSLLEMMYDNQATRRNEIYDFTGSLKRAGVTTMLTSEASQNDPYSSRFGIIEYLTDAVFVLQYIRPDDFQETRLSVEIQKIRDANHSREMKPYELTSDGMSVYQQANIF